MSFLTSHLNAAWKLIYPTSCVICGGSLSSIEKQICIHCKISLPYTNFHQVDQNPLFQLLKGRIELHYISSFLFFDVGFKTRNILHSLKYRKNKELAEEIGVWYGEEIKEYLPRDIDIIVPVPLHPKKQKIRGYNQSEAFAVGLEKSTGIMVEKSSLKRVEHTSSQTQKSRHDRVDSVSRAFRIEKNANLHAKRVLLVDDVITTGATIETCYHLLKEAGTERVDILTIACSIK